MRVLRASLLAALLTALTAVPGAIAAYGHGGAGGWQPLPGMQLQSPAALELGGGREPAPLGANADRLRAGRSAADRSGAGRPGARPLDAVPGNDGPNGAQPGGRLSQLGGVPRFRLTCGPSHMAMDDPIVYPGQPGRSHHHTFVGNVSVIAGE